MKPDSNERSIHRRPLQLLAAGIAITLMTTPGVAFASAERRSESSEYVNVDRRESSHHRSGRHYGHKSRGHHGKDHYRSDRRSSRHRSYDRYRHHRRHYRNHSDRYDRRYRSDRYNGSRYGRHHGSHQYRTRHFEIPRRILHDLVHTYRAYHYGRQYYAAHHHYHDVYRFPSYHGHEVKYLPYAYCEGGYFTTGVFGHDGPRFDGHGRY